MRGRCINVLHTSCLYYFSKGAKQQHGVVYKYSSKVRFVYNQAIHPDYNIMHMLTYETSSAGTKLDPTRHEKHVHC